MCHLCSWLWRNMKLLAIRNWTHAFFLITEISKRRVSQADLMHLSLCNQFNCLQTVSPTSVVVGCFIEFQKFCASDCNNMSRVTTNYWFSVLEDFGAKYCCAFGNTAAHVRKLVSFHLVYNSTTTTTIIIIIIITMIIIMIIKTMLFTQAT
jgi:hypothetical protein